MKKKIVITACISLFTISQIFSEDYTKFVDPFIGTTNGGNQNPGARAPFGMVNFSPYNYADTFQDAATYIYGQPKIYGFGLTNLVGTGCDNYGGIQLMPIVAGHGTPVGHHSAYSEEDAEPGYYSVRLSDFNTKAELTTSTRACYGKFTFPDRKKIITIEMSRVNTQDTAFYIEAVSKTVVCGYRTDGQFCGKQGTHKVYFYSVFSQPASVQHIFISGKPANGLKAHARHDKILLSCEFDKKTLNVIEVRTGVSYVSIKNAKENLDTEIGNISFEQVRKKTNAKWNELLGRIIVEGTNYNDKVKFYTAIFHTMSHPNIIDDVNGEYPLMEKSGIGRLTQGHRYSVFSLWDTYRTAHPFFTLVYPEIQSDMIKTMLAMADEYGWLPHWECIGVEKGVMNGDPSLIVINDSYQKGIRDFDVRKALKAMMHNSKEVYTQSGVEFVRKAFKPYWANNGYIPYDYKKKGGYVWGSVSTTLEYNLADWNLGQMALALGDSISFKTYNSVSKGWRKLYDSGTGFIRERKTDGSWPEKFDPLEQNGEMSWKYSGGPGYTEGNAWNYLFFPTHDIDYLKTAMGGDSVFTSRLQECFDKEHYAADNEPDLAFPFLFNCVKGQECRTQRQVLKIIEKYFGTGRGSIPGNDDTGTMSAWLVFAMMGFYPLCPGNPSYQICSPLFDKVIIKLNPKYYSGGQFIIETKRSNPADIYIKSIRLNGNKYDNYTLLHCNIVKGGSMEVIMGEGK